MKKKIVRVGALGAIFIIAVIFFSYLTNKDNTDMSTDMGSATLPRISFITNGYEVNSLAGYVTDMEITSMRDTVTPVTDNNLTLNLQSFDEQVEKMTWQVFSLDGEECLQKETVNSVDSTMNLKFNGNGMLNSEKVLKITMHMPEQDVYYYTRIKNAEGNNYDTCLAFVKSFHENAIGKTNTEELRSYLETTSDGDSLGYQHVTLASSLDYVTWGSLKPSVKGNVFWEIKECSAVSTSITLLYQVSLSGTDTGSEQTYDVEEFFRVRVVNNQTYLMAYERTVEQNFDGGAEALDTNGLILGIAPENLEYKHNADGTIVSFVQNDELWSFDKEADELSLIFSFADAEKSDIRNRYNRHEIHIDSVGENGDTLFYVSGYMNRGDHEGQVGIAVYFFNHEKNSVAERAFIPSKKGYEIMQDELGQFVHYSESDSKLYVMLDGCLYCVDTEEDSREVLVRGLEESQYVTCVDSSFLAYKSAEKLIVMNMETGESFELTPEEGDSLIPAGFVNTDFVYGMVHNNEEGTLVSGEKISPMYKVEIVNQKQETVKTYQVDGIWTQKISINENVLTLDRVTGADLVYTATSRDYITSSAETEKSNITLTSYKDGSRGLVRRLTYDDGIQDTSAKILKPKQVLQSKKMNVKFDESKMEGKFYVYAFGHLQKTFSKAGEAISYANNVKGVVVSSHQAYVWERGNWPSAYEIDGIEPFSAAEGETTMIACLEQIFAKETTEADVTKEIEAGTSPENILSAYLKGEGMNLTGCSMEELQYTISRETPVIAVIGENQAVLLTGYNKANVAYLDPATGERKVVTQATMENMTAPYGSVYIGYVRN